MDWRGKTFRNSGDPGLHRIRETCRSVPLTLPTTPGSGADRRPRSPRLALRAATAAAHARLDDLLSTLDLGHPAGYAAFLLSQAPAVAAVERALDEAGAARWLDDWPGRRRWPALVQDLAALGLAPPPAAPGPVLSGEAEVLGAAYVLEGSRLGGALLLRSVPAGLPAAFLRPGNPADWRAFVSLMDKRLSSDTRLADAVPAALAVFTLFEQCARSHLGAARS
jgi:heme oxygenase (biliverdin-IX-beta and delta-forming)